VSAAEAREAAEGASLAETIVRGAHDRLHATGDPRAAQLALIIQLQDLQDLTAKVLGDAIKPEQVSRRQELWDLARQLVAVFHSDDRANGGRRQ
jgi:hypothetical protein